MGDMDEYMEKNIRKVRESFEEKKINKDLLKELYLEYNSVSDIDLFVSRALEYFPALNCGLASVYLRYVLGKGEIISGKFKDHNHTFLKLTDTSIVDITADQYGGPGVYIGKLEYPWTEYLFTVKDTDIFDNPEHKEPEEFKKRTTVKAVVVNDEGKYGFVTNPIHGFILLAGGGAKSDDLEKEVLRECEEEVSYTGEVIKEIGRVHEFRNRKAKEYETVCFLVKTRLKVKEDLRTKKEKTKGLYSVWLYKDEAIKTLDEQEEKVKRGEVGFYNTAFNIVRDRRFFVEYLKDI